MLSPVLVGALGTTVIGIVFSRALHRWADRRVARQFASRWKHQSRLLQFIDSTPLLHESTPLFREDFTPTPHP